MKIHGSRLHADYWRTKFCTCPIVRLDGAELRNVIMADDVIGIVEVGVHRNDKPVVEGGRFKTELRTGRVEIVGQRHEWLKAS